MSGVFTESWRELNAVVKPRTISKLKTGRCLFWPCASHKFSQMVLSGNAKSNIIIYICTAKNEIMASLHCTYVSLSERFTETKNTLTNKDVAL